MFKEEIYGKHLLFTPLKLHESLLLEHEKAKYCDLQFLGVICNFYVVGCRLLFEGYNGMG